MQVCLCVGGGLCMCMCASLRQRCHQTGPDPAAVVSQPGCRPNGEPLTDKSMYKVRMCWACLTIVAAWLPRWPAALVLGLLFAPD